MHRFPHINNDTCLEMRKIGTVVRRSNSWFHDPLLGVALRWRFGGTPVEHPIGSCSFTF